MNILLFFSSLNFSYDFLFPYAIKLSSSMRLFFEKSEGKENIKILDKIVKEPIRIAYKDEVSFVFRKFNNIAPRFNIKKKKSVFLGLIELKPTYDITDLSFTIKRTKKSKK